MTATASNDGWLRTHDDVRGAICAEADRLGARAHVERIDDPNEKRTERIGRYTLRLERIGSEPLTIASGYGLPAPAQKILDHVRSVIQQAAKAAEV